MFFKEGMTVKQLRDELSKLSPDFDDKKVILSRDDDGNGYGYVGEFSSQHYFDKKDWEVWERCDEDDPGRPFPKCVVLWPCNP